MDDSAMDNLHNGWLDWERNSDGRLDGDAMALVMEGLHDGRLGNRWKSLQLTAPQWAGMNGLKVNGMDGAMDCNGRRWTRINGNGRFASRWRYMACHCYRLARAMVDPCPEPQMKKDYCCLPVANISRMNREMKMAENREENFSDAPD